MRGTIASVGRKNYVNIKTIIQFEETPDFSKQLAKHFVPIKSHSCHLMFSNVARNFGKPCISKYSLRRQKLSFSCTIKPLTMQQF